MLLLGPEATFSESVLSRKPRGGKAHMQVGAMMIKLRQRFKQGALMGISKSHRNRDMVPKPWAHLLETDAQ